MSTLLRNYVSSLSRGVDGLVSHRATTGGRYVENFDGLRAVAALMVFCLHLETVPHLVLGPAGVWLFFTLSGYLLYRGFLGLVEPPHAATIVAYLCRRVLRILPLYVVCIFGIALVFNDWGPVITRNWIVEHLLFLRAEGHLWTTKTELIFYLFLPLLILVLYPLRDPRYRTVILLLAAALAWYLFEYKWIITLRGGSPQFAPFILGMAAVHLHRWVKPWFAPWLTFSGAGLILLFGSDFTAGQGIRDWFGLHHPSQMWQFGYLFYIPCTLLVLGVSFSRSRFWANRWLRLIGVCGFGFYLWHAPIILLVREWSLPTPLFEAVCLLATVVLCVVTYLFIERPGMDLGRRVSRWISRDRYRWRVLRPAWLVMFSMVTFFAYRATTIPAPNIEIEVEMWSQNDTHAKVYLAGRDEFSEKIADRRAVPAATWVTLRFAIPDVPLRRLRFDPGETDGEYRIREIAIRHPYAAERVALDLSRFEPRLGIDQLESRGSELIVHAETGHRDPVLVTKQDPGQPWLHSRTRMILGVVAALCAVLLASAGIDRLVWRLDRHREQASAP